MPDLEDGQWIDDDVVITDEANLGTNSYGPGEVESDSFPVTTEPQPATQEESSESGSEEEEPLHQFDPRYREPFEGLMYLGRLQHTFHWLGHEFLIQSVTTEQVLEIGQITAGYSGTVADLKAYQAACVAAAVVEVDGKPLAVPLTTDPTDTDLINQFRYVIRNWQPVVIDVVYEEHVKLEAKVAEVLAEMGKASG